MIERFRTGPRLRWPLLFIIIIISAHASHARGAGLRDIRIGEYGRFTRVVFEFDAAVAPPQISSPSNGQLLVAFKDSNPRLIRKIPQHKSAHIDAIELWQQGPGLTAALAFAVQKFRFEWFALTAPDRIAIDVYPLTIAAPSSVPSIPIAESPTAAERTETEVPGFTDKPEPAASVETEGNRHVEPQTPPMQTLPSFPTATPSPDDSDLTTADSSIRKPQDAPDIESTGASADALEPDVSFTHRLQFYLVIGLVVITVIILGLLVLMLLTRQRLIKEATAIKSRRTMQHQDERISTIDARIEQQLKYYDEI